VVDVNDNEDEVKSVKLENDVIEVVQELSYLWMLLEVVVMFKVQ